MCPKDSVTIPGNFTSRRSWDMFRSSWDLVRLRSVPLWDGGVSQEILSKAPRSLHSMRMRPVVNNVLALELTDVEFSLLARGFTQPRGRSWGRSDCYRQRLKHRPCVIEKVSAVRFAWQSNTSLVSSTGACSVLLMYLLRRSDSRILQIQFTLSMAFANYPTSDRRKHEDDDLISPIYCPRGSC